MRNLKKFLALVLALAMAFSLMLTANAANEKDNGSNKYPDGQNVTAEFVEAVDVLYGMGIMTGDNGNFYPERGVMRSEMAAVLYRLMTGDTGNLKDELYANLAAERFYDVKATDWFASYVGWCYDAGIMVGSGGYFRPSAYVTGYETEVMVLRAMGYGKNSEYTGGQWKINASYDATVNGLLRDVVNTNYSSTLSANTRRDVVASIVFQAAQLPTVTWTPSLGYNKYIGVATATGSNQYNPSLGETHFGLTCATGIVVGNQATGESVTKIGFTKDPDMGTVNSIMVNGSPSGDPNQNRVGQNAYVYADNATYIVDPDGTPSNGKLGNSTESFAWETDLSLFNHAVKVWYNGNGGTHKTYALYDQATATAVVTTTATIDNLTPANLALLVDGKADAANNWDDTKMVAGSGAYFNYSFAAMNQENYAASADGKYSKVTANVSGSGIADNDPITAVSPVKNTNADTINTSTQHPLYLLISNSGNKQIDVVISLDLTMTKVVQSNTTTYPYSVGVLNINGGSGTAVTSFGSNGYFGVGTDEGRLVNSTSSADPNYVSLLTASLLNTSEDAQKLNTKVAAIEITGTRTGVANDGSNAQPGTRGDFNPDTGNTTFTSTFYYQLTQPTHTLTGKVVKVDTANNDVYLEGGKVLHQSVYAEATDETFIQNDNTARTSGMEGFDQIGTIGFRLQAGRDYTFTLDAEDGNYIYWETAAVTSNFVYGTYIDWETKTASSEFIYPLVYVNTNGDQRQVANISSVTDLAGVTTAMGTTLYDSIILPKRDSTTINSSGYIKGIYKGYALSSTGALTEVGTAANSTGFVRGDAAFGTTAVTINNNSVTLGAQATNTATLFLTENTQFYIVDGAGTDNQTVTPYKGISELMKDMSSVVINGQTSWFTTAKEGKYLDSSMVTSNMGAEMFYYQAGPFEYDQSYAPSAQEIKTIYLPKQCVEFTASSTTSLVFVGESTATMYNANNGNPATQFTVYNTKGEAVNVWIEGDFSAPGTHAYVVSNNGNGAGNNDNVFYELRDSGKKATDGNVIYQIDTVNNAERTVIGQYWDSATSTVKWTTTTLAGSTNALYKATTYSQQVAYIDDAAGYGASAQLYNVGAAGIKNLNTTAYPGIVDNNLSTLNGAGSLATNTGVPVSCILNASSDITVDFIFVNA